MPVYGLGTYAGGRPYYAMRFIKGDSLKEAIEHFHGDDTLKNDPGRRSLELRKLLRRFLDVCNAIDYAHSRGVIHRDIKPANIILGRHGETLVVDWGLAKAVGRADPSSGEQTIAPSSSGSSETLPGSALGTPAYMSPEQAGGDLDRLGPRSDVYSLGATLYCLLTGKPPFEGDDIGEILRKVQARRLRAAPGSQSLAGQGPGSGLPQGDGERAGGSLPVVPGAGRGRGAVDGRRAGLGLGRAVDAEAAALADAAPHRRDRHGGGRAGRRGGAVGGAGRADAGQRPVVASLTRETKASTALAAANARLVDEQAKVQARFELAQKAIATFHTGVSEDMLLKNDQFKELRTKLLKEAAAFYGDLEKLLTGQTDARSRKALAAGIFQLAELTRQDRLGAGGAGRPSQGPGNPPGIGGGARCGRGEPAGRGPQPALCGRLLLVTGDDAGALTSVRGGTRPGRTTGGRSPDERGPVRLGRYPRILGRLLLFHGEAGGGAGGPSEVRGHPTEAGRCQSRRHRVPA